MIRWNGGIAYGARSAVVLETEYLGPNGVGKSLVISRESFAAQKEKES
jgi:hypothetical protein